MNPSMSVFAAKQKSFSRNPPANLPAPEPFGATGKVEQSAAAYTDGEDTCSFCRHFNGVDACSKVNGEISPSGHSKYFERDESSSVDRDDNDSADANLGIVD